MSMDYGRYLLVTYEIKAKILPSEVLRIIQNFMKDHHLICSHCFWNFENPIIELGYNEKKLSNRENDSIIRICNEYPELSDCYTIIPPNEERAFGAHRMGNLYNNCYTPSRDGLDSNDIISEIISKIPKQYKINELIYLFDGINFGQSDNDTFPCSVWDSKGDGPRGSFIMYSRSVVGSEKHSYLYIETEIRNGDLGVLRPYIQNICQVLPGRYKGSEILQ